MNKKKTFVLAISLLLIISIVIGIVLIHKKNEDDKIKKIILPIAEHFYEETYYQTVNEELLKDFTNIGINISLEELIEYEEEKINVYKKYDTNKSNIMIYPKSPYNKDDYTIEIKLYRK